MTTIIITALILIILALKVIQQGIRLNGYEDEENSREIEKHPFINGDCCRCEECTDRYHEELAEDLTSNNK